MKQNKLLKLNIFLIVALLLFGVGAIVFCTPKPTEKVYANNLEQLQIENDGSVISSELWVALYNVYQSAYNEKPVGDVLTLDMFKGCPLSYLNLSTNAQGQSYDIKSISGLGSFDLSSFTTINLSGNKISMLNDELKSLKNLIKLDLSNNLMGSFKTDMLDSSCLSALQILDLSNNGISDCDLTGLQIAQINLQNNNLTDTGLTYPQTDLVINLNNNYLTTLSTEKTNVVYGYQGAKNDQVFEKSTEILFAPNSSLGFTKIEIYENNQLFDTLIENEKITLNVGNYTLKFLNANQVEVQDSISFKVMLPKVTAKLFVDGKEIDFTSVLTQNTVIKFYGEDGAEIFVFSNKSSETKNVAEYEITENGTIIVSAYQTKDGYSSNTASFYFNVKKPTIGSWIIVGVGIVAIILLYFVVRYILQKITFKNSSIKKGKLD